MTLANWTSESFFDWKIATTSATRTYKLMVFIDITVDVDSYNPDRKVIYVSFDMIF